MSIIVCEVCERRFDTDIIDNMDDIMCRQEGQCPITEVYNFNGSDLEELDFNE